MTERDPFLTPSNASERRHNPENFTVTDEDFYANVDASNVILAAINNDLKQDLSTEQQTRKLSRYSNALHAIWTELVSDLNRGQLDELGSIIDNARAVLRDETFLSTLRDRVDSAVNMIENTHNQ